LLLLPLQDTRWINARSEYDRAWQLFLRGELTKSQIEAAQGYARFQLYDPAWALKFRLLEATAMVWRGIYQEAVTVLEAVPSNLLDAEERIEKLTDESVAYTRLQNFPEAEHRLAQAESLCAVSRITACGGVVRARGVVALERGQFKQARQYFVQSLSFAREFHDRSQEATALVNLGFVSLQDEHYDEAMDWLKDGYRADIELGDEDRAQGALGNLGWAYFNLGDRERAQELFLEAEKSAARRGNIRSQLGWITTLGYVYQSSGELARASALYSQALALARQINSKEDIVNSLEVLAHLSVDAGDLDKASSYIDRVAPLVGIDGNHLDLLDVQFARGRLAAARRQDVDAETIFRTVAEDASNQTSMRLAAKYELAELYERQGKTKSADLMYRAALSTFETARDQLQNEASKLPFLANATRIYDGFIHFLVMQGKSNEALAVADTSRALTLAQGLGVSTSITSSKSANLHPGEIARKAHATLLFYWLGQKQSYLWAIAPEKTALFPLPAQSEINALVGRYAEAVAGPNDAIDASNEDGLALYRLLVAPAEKLIRPGSPVVILNDGQLSRLNFETLIVPGLTPHYWIEDATLISAQSLHMLSSAKPASATERKVLLLGNAVSPDPDFPELPMAAIEMKQIERHFPASDQTVFTREHANSEAYLRSTPQQYSYIHFVAHGVASRTDPLDSAIILSRSSKNDDSYKLYAREIIRRPIHARLVTISACSGSGSKSYAGEGLVGLSWAFLRAGAHNVIGALWEVSDDSTPRLMDALYQGIEDGLSPSAALRKAKLTLLHSDGRFRSPFFWAPFQIYAGL
jgi:CHAT domain-containing protein/Flp pilus assembly protein TadD